MQNISIANGGSMSIPVSKRLAGGNLLFDRDKIENGTFDSAVNALNITSLRYPGGTISEKYFDITNPDADHYSDEEENEKSLLPISDFFHYCAENDISASVVVPTRTMLLPGMHGFRQVDPEALKEVGNFIEEVLSGKYGSVKIDYFEIGNEYWLGGEMTALEYGRVASATALEIENAITRASIKSTSIISGSEPKIAVQIGQKGKYSKSEPGWIQNDIIMGEFDKAEASAVDAIIGHWYLRGSYSDDASSQWFFDRLNSWRKNDRFGDLDLIITEWNTDHLLSTDRGLSHGAAILSMYAEMVENGIAAAWAWPVQQNTPNDLFSKEGEEKLTIGGLTFSFINKFAPGSTFLGVSENEGVEQYNFSTDSAFVSFVANSSGENRTFEIFSDLPAHDYAWTAKISTSDSPSKPNAKPTLQVNTIPNLSEETEAVDLEPHELALIVSPKSHAGAFLPDLSRLLDLGVEADVTDGSLHGTDNDDQLFGCAGADRIYSGLGDDFIRSGSGDDDINIDAGLKDVLAGTGNDTIYCAGADGAIYGESGSDSLHLQQSSPFLLTVRDVEQVFGSESGDLLLLYGNKIEVETRGGDDIVTVYSEDATINSGTGNDTIDASCTNSTINCGDGNDSIHISGAGNVIYAGSGSDRAVGGDSDDIIFTGAGDDTIFSSFGDDTYSGGPGADTFKFFDQPNRGTDIIRDFEPGVDKIILSDYFDGYEHVELLKEIGPDVHVDYAFGSSVVIRNTELADLEGMIFHEDITSFF